MGRFLRAVMNFIYPQTPGRTPYMEEYIRNFERRVSRMKAEYDEAERIEQAKIEEVISRYEQQTKKPKL
eukprot:EC723196.1.p1 GENE.EC723196.1~~EC723196.1.p1  ORF type:complete len:69 (+),score=1.00 EC723196.1:102-308(+)